MEEQISRVNQQNTKKEIYDAYEELLEKYQKIKDSPEKGREVRHSEEKEIVKKAGDYQGRDIAQEITALKLSISRTLDEIGEKMLEKKNELKQLDQVIDIENRRLEEIHQIQVQANTLAELMKLHQEERKKYQEKMDTLKAEYEHKKEAMQQEFTEEQTQIKRRQEKAEDEYEYNLKLKRRKEQEAFSEDLAKRRREFEQELADRVKEVDAREKKVAGEQGEASRLKSQVSGFEQLLKEKVNAAQEQIRQEMQREFGHEKEILLKTSEGEKRLAELKIENLQTSLQKVQEDNNRLKEELQRMVQQVQEIAVKTIEGRSKSIQG